MSSSISARLRLSKSRVPRKPQKPRSPVGEQKGLVYTISPEKLLLYADRGLVVINKPNGMITQVADSRILPLTPNVDTNIFLTFMEDLRKHLKLKEPLRPLHRLDKPTTGALALACTRQNAKDFSRQISFRKAEKTYLALVCGDSSKFAKPRGIISTKLECEQGWVRIPGARRVFEREQVRNPRIRGENWVKDAISEYEVVASSTKVPLSLLRLQLHTGLKHQLRVHLAQYLRTPILGDNLYMDVKSPIMKTIKSQVPIPWGLFLHSSRFSLLRYRPSEFRLTVGAPLPPSFVDICEKAGIPLDYDDVTGGVWADDQKVRGADIVSPEDQAEDAVQQLGGVWFGASLHPEEDLTQ
ncbi:pseudouridine synthase [Lentinus tigrinus ALCF2SS1-7]|uniref:21S rRNA pseudouridine(2819) synthase n=1 Tax=Lentinus tigrinus ALCF2SS1-6 TaxID=1328759 RepID=A0A5C2RQ22_9APHY|nr:pseudouridine synthase [Lentinus tigrinus ALCF2SS1-6]RPD76797.1 pseudouridine synthase [Lentinus tigrinus ALCF2SS1-7]